MEEIKRDKYAEAHPSVLIFRKNREAIFNNLKKAGITKKRCRSCGEERDIELFSVDKSKKDSLAWRCKTCAKIAMNEYHRDTRGAMASEVKACIVCGRERGRNEFSRNIHKDDLREDFCRECAPLYWQGMQEKVCTKCGRVRLVEDFWRDRSHKGGREAQCKECLGPKNDALRKRQSKINKEAIARALEIMGPCVDCGNPSKVVWPPVPGGKRKTVGGLMVPTAKKILKDPVVAKRDLVPVCLDCYEKRMVHYLLEYHRETRERLSIGAAEIIGYWCVDCLEKGVRLRGTHFHHRIGDGYLHRKQNGERVLGDHLRRWVINNPEEAKEKLVPLCQKCHTARHTVAKQEARAKAKAERELRKRDINLDKPRGGGIF